VGEGGEVEGVGEDGDTGLSVTAGSQDKYNLGFMYQLKNIPSKRGEAA
jgi:hypothetical protein